MPSFLSPDFLLQTPTARRLFHNHAADLPIIDYHCHLSPADIASNRSFKTITEIWLEGDHYKWRAMRAFGIPEEYITGSASDEEKFKKWAETVPHTLRNPLYHWTHLELQRYFGIQDLLSEKTADSIYNACNDKLQQPTHSVHGLLTGMKVEMIGTTDDPTDGLEYHKAIASSTLEIKVLPSFRPDPALATHDAPAFNNYLNRLTTVTGKSVHTLDDLFQLLRDRIDYFHDNGCRLSDHGLEYIPVPLSNGTDPAQLFQLLTEGKNLPPDEAGHLKFILLTELCRMYHAKGWTQQFHLGALRNNNTRMMKKLGANTGYDSIGDFRQAPGLAALLDALDSTDQLTRTILYNLNPADNELFATMAGNFNDGTIRGKVQYGSGWWFLDQKDGMEKQLNSLSNMGLLSTFIGMLTDSRSFLSYPRHEYFRRILCNLIGRDVENGELPNDEEMLSELIRGVCYENAKRYL